MYNIFLKRTFLWHDAGWPGKKHSWLNTIIYNILNSYFSQNIQFLFHHTDQSSNTLKNWFEFVIMSTWDWSVHFSQFQPHPHPTSIHLAVIFWYQGILKRWLFAIYLEFKSEFLNCGLIQISFFNFYRIIRSIGRMEQKKKRNGSCSDGPRKIDYKKFACIDNIIINNISLHYVYIMHL